MTPTKSKPPAWAVRTVADRLALEAGYYWDSTRAKQIVRFAETCFRSQFIRGNLKLLEWQRRLLMSLYGWRHPSGARRWKVANLHTSKKNGKTMITAIVACFELYFSESPSPLVLTAAASKDNASQIFNEVSFTLRNGPLWDEADVDITEHQKRVRIRSINGELKTIASEGARVHGWHTTSCVIDECHAVKKVELYHAVKYSTIARQGLLFLISTAGNDTNHWYYAVYSKSKRILSGEETADLRTYAEVHESDPDADLENDRSQWYKACPSLGTSYTEEDYRDELISSKSEGMATWLNFQQLMGNRWVRPHVNAWLDMLDFDKYKRDYTDDELKRFNARGMGVDLSETVCPTSCGTLFDLGDRHFFLKLKGWVAAGGVQKREASNMPKYQQFADLEITDGDMIDRDKVVDYIVSTAGRFGVQQINFDPRSAYVIGNDVERAGYGVGRFHQGERNYDPIMREFERAWKEGRIFHDGSPWLRYCLSNVRVRMNRYGEMGPDSGRSVDHIDGAIAALLAFREVIQPEGGGAKIAWT